MSFDAEKPARVRKEWAGSGQLRRDAHHVTATHGDAGVIWARETGATTRIRLKLVDGFLDLREEVLESGQWRWTFRGVQIETSCLRALVDAVSGTLLEGGS